MSLVGYDYSDSEEDDQEVANQQEEPIKNVSEKLAGTTTELGNSSTSSTSNSESTNAPTKPSQLPPAQPVISTLKKDLVKRSANGRIQITADLSLLNAQHSDDSDDEEERERKRLKRSMQGSRLITMLPKPKNPTKPTVQPKSSLTSLVPNSVANRSKAQNPVSTTATETVEKKPEKPTSSTSSFFFTNSDDDDEDDDNPLPTTAKEIYPTAFPTSAIAPDLDARPVYGPSKPEIIPEAILADSLYSPIDQSVPKLDPNNDITYKKYIASKFGEEASAGGIKFVDFDMSKHLSQNTDWIKNITIEKEDRDEEEDEKSAPNSTARRKNQITFLAYQAKKRETELKNQWAANRLSKNKTRAKYGF